MNNYTNKVITNKWKTNPFILRANDKSLYLMTELKGSGRSNGVEVAMDTAPLSNSEDAYGGLYIGTGKNLEAGTFFSGLIDDIRIYNVALTTEQIESLVQ